MYYIQIEGALMVLYTMELQQTTVAFSLIAWTDYAFQSRYYQATENLFRAKHSLTEEISRSPLMEYFPHVVEEILHHPSLRR